MQYQICECGEQILPNELGTKLLAHWQHQQRCLYSYIGCVSRFIFHKYRIRRSIINFFPPKVYTVFSNLNAVVLLSEYVSQRCGRIYDPVKHL